MSNVVPIIGNQTQKNEANLVEKGILNPPINTSTHNIDDYGLYRMNSNGSSNNSNNSTMRNLKNKLRDVMYNPISSEHGRYFSIFLALTIVTSSVLVIIETLPRFYMQKNPILFVIETIIMTLFTLEFLTRCFIHSDSKDQFMRFFLSFQTFMDLLAISPYYIELLVLKGHISEFQSFTVFRLFRLLRLFKCFRASNTLQLPLDAMTIAIENSADALMAIVIFLSFTAIVFSTLIYFAERGTFDPIRRIFIDSDGLPSKFNSIPATFWFVLETITTIGLGDIVPKTIIGKVISFPLMLSGVLIIALPSIVIGKNFSEVTMMLRAERHQKVMASIPNNNNNDGNVNVIHHGNNNNNVQILIEMVQQLTQQNSLLMELLERQKDDNFANIVTQEEEKENEK